MNTRLFALYDADGDGVIQRSEIRDVIVAAYRLSGQLPGIYAYILYFLLFLWPRVKLRHVGRWRNEHSVLGMGKSED